MFLMHIWLGAIGVFTAGSFLSAVIRFGKGEIVEGIFFFAIGAILLPILSLSEVNTFLISWAAGAIATTIFLGLMLIFNSRKQQ